jgi:hypothetical protein
MPPCPSDSHPTIVDNSSVKTVASLVGRRRFEEVLDVICCYLHTWYLTIHAGFVSIDDEPTDKGRGGQRPSRRGTLGDCVGDDIELGCRNQGGAAEARMRLDADDVDRGGGDGVVWQSRVARV